MYIAEVLEGGDLQALIEANATFQNSPTKRNQIGCIIDSLYRAMKGRKACCPLTMTVAERVTGSSPGAVITA